MAKNIVVTDAKGNAIGSTYPKRARGLVKHGRAVYVDDCTIRLLHTTAPSVVTKNDNKEHFFMKNIIEFKSKDFRFGSMHKYGGRMFVTKNGSNREVFELGTVDDWKRQGAPGSRDRFGTWLFAKKDLEPHTDYVFRIEVVSDGTLCDGSELRAAIFDVLDPDDKTGYPLAQSRFAPSVSKKTADGGLVRVFELPYSTGDGSEYQINIFAYDCRVILDAPAEPEAYASLEDCAYAEWRAAQSPAKDPEETLTAKLNIIANAVAVADRIINDSASEAEDDEDEDDEDEDDEDEDDEDEDDENEEGHSVIDITGKSYDENGFAQLLERIDDGCVASVQDVNVTSAAGASYTAGDLYQADGATLDIKGLNATTAAFTMLVSKIGDGSVVCINGSNEIVDRPQMNDDEPIQFDGVVLSICESQLSAYTACRIIAAIGDGCNVEFKGCSITSDGADLAGAFAEDLCGADGTIISFRGSSVPDELKRLVKAKAKNSEGFTYEF